MSGTAKPGSLQTLRNPTTRFRISHGSKKNSRGKSKSSEQNENETVTPGHSKSSHRTLREFPTPNARVVNEETPPIRDPSSHPKILKAERQSKPHQQKEVVEIRAEMKKIGM
jgi:hypothetical protein